jgi:hypothetical protein
MGWFGRKDHMIHALRTMGADTDEDGRYLVKGHVVSGLGGEEMVIGNDAQYRMNGQWCGLVGLMNSTSYGIKIHVIGYDE